MGRVAAPGNVLKEHGWEAVYGALLTGAASLPIVLYPNDWLGWLLAYTSFVVVALPQTIREDRRMLLVAWLILTTHHIIALVFAYIGPTPGAKIDALTFHDAAAYLANRGDLYLAVDYHFYENLLGGIYRLFGTSKLLGSQLSVMACAASIVLFAKYMQALRLDKDRALLLLIFGMWPTLLFVGSVTLREAWELVFFMGACLAGLRYQENKQWRDFLLLILMAALLGAFHKALVVFGAALIALFMIAAVINRFADSRAMRRFFVHGALLLLCLVLGLYAIQQSEVNRELIIRMFSEDILENIRWYRIYVDAEGEPRSAFDIPFEVQTTFGIFKTFGLMYVYYLFAPFSGGAENVKDVYAISESLLRFVLIGFSLLYLVAVKDRAKRIAFTLLIIYVGMTFMWSIGTTNYGQAIRHHVLTNWIIVLLGAPLILSMARQWRQAAAAKE